LSTGVWLLLRLILRLRRRQRQPCCIVQNLPLPWRELVEAAGLQGALARVGRHGAQILDSASYSLLAIRRKAVELWIDWSKLLLLLRRQMLPGFHAVKHLLLLIARQSVEVLQALLKLLLPVRR
jgi:hypothetical protein